LKLIIKINITILVSPRIENDITNIEAIFNSTVNLTCSAYGNPKPTVKIIILKKNKIFIFERILLDCMV
jgi:hypothetical protein